MPEHEKLHNDIRTIDWQTNVMKIVFVTINILLLLSAPAVMADPEKVTFFALIGLIHIISYLRCMMDMKINREELVQKLYELHRHSSTDNHNNE